MATDNPAPATARQLRERLLNAADAADMGAWTRPGVNVEPFGPLLREAAAALAAAEAPQQTCPDCGNRPVTEPRTVGCQNAAHLQADSLRRLGAAAEAPPASDWCPHCGQTGGTHAAGCEYAKFAAEAPPAEEPLLVDNHGIYYWRKATAFVEEKLEAAEARAAQAEGERDEACAGESLRAQERDEALAQLAVMRQANKEGTKALLAAEARAAQLEHRLQTVANILGVHERDLTTAARTLWADNARLRAALEQVEWADNSGDEYRPECPWCHNEEREGHAPNCARVAALRQEAR